MKNEWNIGSFSEFKDKLNRNDFNCGNEHLNDFIKTNASQYEKINYTKVYLAIIEKSNLIAGYYTLSTSSVELTNIPSDVAKKIPKHPRVLVALIGKLAVDKNFQGQGLGVFLLMDAIDRVLKIASESGCFAIEVDAIDENAKNFYSKYGFKSLLEDEKHMYITIKNLKKLI